MQPINCEVCITANKEKHKSKLGGVVVTFRCPVPPCISRHKNTKKDALAK